MFVEELKNTKEWETFLKGTPRGTFYHSLEWKNVIEKSFSHPTVYLVIKDENGRIAGICPTVIWTSRRLRILDSMPYSDYGGPVIEKKCLKEASHSLLGFIEHYSLEKDISCAKLCCLKDGSQKFFKSPRYYVDSHKGVTELDLAAKPADVIRSKILSISQRKKIRRLELAGFTIREACSKSDLAEFLNVYYSNMQYIGASAFPIRFFENLWSLLYPQNFNILLAEKESTVGGLAFFSYGEKVYLTYLGISREMLTSSYSMFPYLSWNATKWAERNGFRYVCFGTTPAHPKSAHEMANYSQKVKFGASFLQQETVFIPFDFYASAFLLFGSKAVSTWSAVRNRLPAKLQRSMETKLRGIF
jgi:hypothetical protein